MPICLEGRAHPIGAVRSDTSEPSALPAKPHVSGSVLHPSGTACPERGWSLPRGVQTWLGTAMAILLQVTLPKPGIWTRQPPDVPSNLDSVINLLQGVFCGLIYSEEKI